MHPARQHASLTLIVTVLFASALPRTAPGSALPDASCELKDIISQDVEHFSRLLGSPMSERRVEGIQGLSYLKYWPAEEALIRLLDDSSDPVRREAVLALCRLGTIKSVPRLIALLDNASWEVQQNAWHGLRQITAQKFPAKKSPWEQWWRSSSVVEKQNALLATLKPMTNAIGSSRHDALRALLHHAPTSAEETFIDWLRASRTPPLDADERSFVAETLERIGTAKAVSVLAAERSDAAAWALGRIGGTEAEQALLDFPKTLATLLALDRVHSTNCLFIPYLVNCFGLVTYRGQPDDLMNEDAQPIQRVAANLILRSGQAPLLMELVLQELEDSMNPPLAHGPCPQAPARWTKMLTAMRGELKPGFVRGDGLTTSQPLTAFYQIANDPALAPRLLSLLRHPAFVPRIYVAMTLGKLHAQEAVPAIVDIIREGYSFSDSTALASGKHFDQSQVVRWRGFLCMALGRLGGSSARQALEQLATDAKQPRDVRYSSVVGLRFIGSSKSLPALERAANDDIVWMVRDEARRTANSIQIVQQEARR